MSYIVQILAVKLRKLCDVKVGNQENDENYYYRDKEKQRVYNRSYYALNSKKITEQRNARKLKKALL